MLAREETMSSPMLQDELHKVLRLSAQGSDSAMLDNTLEVPDHEAVWIFRWLS